MGNQRFGIWKLKRHAAQLNWQQHVFQFDAASPENGATLSWADGGLVETLFRVPQVQIGDLSQIDPYVRGCDLIVAYPSGEARNIGAELYWRWAEFAQQEIDDTEDLTDESNDESPAVGTLELIYSQETQLLDTRPQPHVSSTIAGDTMRYFVVVDGRLNELDDDSTSSAGSSVNKFHACLIERSDQKVLLMAMPSDLKEWVVAAAVAPAAEKVSEDGTGRGPAKLFQVDCHLESEFLEKGVIRRARLFAAFGSAASESQLLAAAINFLNSDIPLTA